MKRRWTRGGAIGHAMLLGAFSAGLCFAGPLGSLFVTGHDPDFHALMGNTVGAQHMIQVGLDFVRNGNDLPILFIDSGLGNLSLEDHIDSERGLQASGYSAGNTPGNHYVKVTAAEFPATNLSLYSAIFVPSAHGGTLSGDYLAVLNAHHAGILAYLNAGGGLFALAEDGQDTRSIAGPAPANFGYLPFLVSGEAKWQPENGYHLTPFGASLGLVASDINNNFSHNIFLNSAGMNIVDTDAAGNIVSLAYRGNLTSSGAAPEPSALLLAGAGLAALLLRRKFRRA